MFDVRKRDGKVVPFNISKISDAIKSAFDAQEVSFGNYTLTAGPSEGNPGDGKKSQEVPQGFTDGCVLRTRRPGDRIRPFGSKTGFQSWSCSMVSWEIFPSGAFR